MARRAGPLAEGLHPLGRGLPCPQPGVLVAFGDRRLSIEAVARRAGVGKTTVYRRRPTKEVMVVAVLGPVVVAAVDVPDTPADIGVELALDLIGGPLYLRLAVVRSPRPPDYLDRLTDRVVAALRA